MKRGDITTIEKLAIGDRFYFSNDKQKIVWNVEEHKHQAVKYGALSTIIKIPGSKFSKHVKSGREVVFLRNVNDVTK